VWGGCGGGAADGARIQGGRPDPNRSGPGADLRALTDTLSGEVSVYYAPLDSGEAVTVDGDVRMHAASTMKIPVMIQLFRDRDAGRGSLDDPVLVDPEFSSIVDGSPYTVSRDSDSDTTLHTRIGETVPVRELVDLMITRSSNLATNLLVDRAGAHRVNATMADFGVDSMEVLRGVEDLRAFEAGLSNTTTARDLGRVLRALGRGEAASPPSTEAMIGILEAQEFRSRIPAGLPRGTRVANKTGTITGIAHDAALVYPDAASPYVLVVLTRGFAEPESAGAAMAEVARRIHRAHLRSRRP
jgi:beta-lactamase class A